VNIIRDTIENAAPPAETDEEAIARLAALDPLEYDRQRESAANAMGVRVVTLDEMVRQSRKAEEETEARDELAQGVEPWPESVSADALLVKARLTLKRYCILPHGADVALSLWVLAGYAIDAFRIFPKVCLSSPEKRCGKTTTLEVIGALAHRSLTASSATPSVLFRAIDAWRPTLLIDEADTFLAGNDELRGIINSGHTRSGAFVLRTEGDASDRRPVKFSTWSPMVIAMIKTPPDTIRDRSIMVMLRRKLPGERVARLPFDLADELTEFRRKCRRWADDHEAALKTCRPEVPEVGNDRAMDNWLPLLAVADTVGGQWPELARNAMVKMEVSDDTDDGIGPMILRDVREVFETRKADRLFSDELVAALIDMEERPWCEWRHGKPLTKNSLARLLKPFEVRSRALRIGSVVQKGYALKDCQDAFDRYLPPTPPAQSVTTLQANNDAGSSGFKNETPDNRVTDEKTLQPNSGAGCNVVTDEKGGIRQEGMKKRRAVL